MQIRNIMDLFVVIDKLYHYLAGTDICFDKDGFPIFRQEMFLDEWPELIIPFSQRKNRRVTNKKKTVLCFFDKDHHLYPRLRKVMDEIEEYKQFMGVVGIDVTVTDDMDQEWQRAILLLNQLFLAVLAVNGVKIILNTRTGGQSASDVFRNMPAGTMAASGFLGCNNLAAEDDFTYLEKILVLLPEKLIIYGKHDSVAEHQLDAMGINYRVYKDFHRLCKEVHHG
ncbi:DUF4417 domain-containing protein [Butyrivibrio sp. INlla14]|uniref:DUF4417 domain-containing protein n=1 Tax=Butyrivibrio sp. INlla14 TaxID=1520808 RepID=UPI0008768195|nr:DUF4417 domain-containing protein [Butyrivibrio sp. INlla14]SCY14240.1 protein of unknown function [Butyrivibrio sp. INlla14]